MRFARALLPYLLVWVLGGAVVVAAVVTIGGGGRERVELPPVQATQLSSAARTAGCDLRRDTGRGHLNPPAAGPHRAVAAAPGVYDAAPPVDRVIAAARRGIITIQYREGVTRSERDQLEALQRTVPSGTIIAPNATGMPYRVAAVGWRNMLGCRRLSPPTIDALRLFRGRFIGRGPDGGG